MRTIHRRKWIGFVACGAIAMTLLGWFYLSRNHSGEETVSVAEDEVYEAVVRDMITPIDGATKISRLVFDKNVITELRSGENTRDCKERARKYPGLENNAPPEFNSLADKIYRALTGGWYDGSLRADAIQDFLEKSCSAGRLSTTFHTDVPRTFVAIESVHFNGWPVEKYESTSFEELFPGAPGIISFSHVGFDSTFHEAIVSTAFVCGGLCGSGHRYVLKKRRGRWEVATKRMVWVS